MSTGAVQSGFSLIEALVALSVLAIAAVGLTRTVESHIDSTRALERRATAMWVAETRLAELSLGARGMPEQVEMLNQQWLVTAKREPTDDRAIERVRIAVRAPGEEAPLATLDGFVEAERR